MSTAERFWTKVDIRGEDECWPWTASLNTNGYGQFVCPTRKRPIPASRFAVELERGPLPPGFYALHTCDNRMCVNPAHLYVGTLSDNTQDMLRRGRNRSSKGMSLNRGSQNGNSKLNEAAVREIRVSTDPVREIAQRYGVSEASIYYILERKTWRHV